MTLQQNYFGLKAKINLLPHNQWLGNAIDTVGTALNLPEFGLSEKAANGNTTFTGITPQSQEVFGAITYDPRSTTGFINPVIQRARDGSGPTNTNTNTNTNTGGGGNNNVSSVGYNPTHEGQTVEINGNTYRSNANGGWDLVNSSGSDETNRLIDQAYGESDNYLNQAEQMLRGDQPNVLNDINSQFDITGKQITANKDTTFSTLNSQLTQAEQRKQNVMSDARRMYEELQRGYRQRFGGSSSAGQAATELGNLEQQRQQGRTMQDYNNFANQVAAKRVEVERDYHLKQEKLTVDKDSAIRQANQEFSSKLLQISSARAQNSQAKAQAKLSALQDLRNKLYQINLAELEFKQNLTLQYQQNQQLLNSYQQNNSQSIATSQAALLEALSGRGLSTQTSNLQTSNTSGANTTNPYLGRVSRPDEETLMGYAQPVNRDEYQSLLV